MALCRIRLKKVFFPVGIPFDSIFAGQKCSTFSYIIKKKRREMTVVSRLFLVVLNIRQKTEILKTLLLPTMLSENNGLQVMLLILFKLKF